MLVIDRVFCDCCGNYVGQLFNASPDCRESLPDLSTAPEFVTCPDCELVNRLEVAV